MRPPFPIAVDNSMRSAFVSCPKKFELTYLHHWKPIGESVDLVAGKAFAAGIEATRNAFWVDGLSAEHAVGVGAKALILEYGDLVPPPSKANKSCSNMLEALQDYFHNYGFHTDPIQPHKLPSGKLAIEVNFALPLDDNLRHPESGDPILFTGRFDMIGEREGELWGVDEKTTGRLGDQWYTNWPLRAQLTGYTWAAREYGYPVAGIIIRGVAVLKTKITHAESIQHRPQWHCERWREQFIRDVRRMIHCWEEGYFDWALDTACTDYGGCTFLKNNICTSPQPERWLSTGFEQRIWDPIKREETPL